MKRFFYITILFAALCSCTKEIEIDYRAIEPIPVIEGYLSADMTQVKVTRTRNMNDSATAPGISVDDVKIVMPDGSETPLAFDADGIYRPTSPIALTDYATYTLEVTIDGVTYTGASTLLPKIEITEPEFVWAELMDWMQVLEFETVNIADGEEAYGWVRLHRNGEIYFSDAGKCTGNSPFDIGLYYDSDMELDEEMILYDGDTLLLEVRHIDLGVYNYLSEYNSTHRNPAQFFTPSVEGKTCLGYFAAFSHVTREMIYRKTPHE